jgi:hypothetical protein
MSAAADRIADSLLTPISEVDEEGFFAVTESDQYLEDISVLNDFVVDECDVTSSPVKAIDYAFDADLDSLMPGLVAFEFENAGTEVHEMALISINEGTTETIQELLELPDDEAEAKTRFIGIGFAAPGDSQTVFADMSPGRYAILCFIPQGTTSFEEAETADGPPHFTLGMVKEFTVEG